VQAEIFGFGSEREAETHPLYTAANLQVQA
jgi:hypothetical protein